MARPPFASDGPDQTSAFEEGTPGFQEHEADRVSLTEFADAFGDSMGALICDESGRILSVSNGFSAMIGIDRDSLVGMPLGSLFPGVAEDPAGRLSPQRISSSGLFALRHRDGHLRNVVFWCRPVLTSTPQPRLACLVRKLGADEIGMAVEAQDERKAARALLEQLTDREWSVLRNIAQGVPNRVTAKQLDVSQRTIESDRSSIQRKLGARSLAEVLRIYLLGQSHVETKPAEPRREGNTP